MKLLAPHVKELFGVLMDKGKAGDVAAIKELLTAPRVSEDPSTTATLHMVIDGVCQVVD